MNIEGETGLIDVKEVGFLNRSIYVKFITWVHPNRYSRIYFSKSKYQ